MIRTVSLRSLRPGLLSLGLGLLSAGCGSEDGARTGEACAESNLIEQCPGGSNPVLGAQAESGCSGKADGSYVTESGSASGQCHGTGSCSVLCQFVVPCTCGVASATKQGVTCAPCTEQKCGNGLCEGTERATCAAGQTNCAPCPVDCPEATCGDGVCNGTETPATCAPD